MPTIIDGTNLLCTIQDRVDEHEIRTESELCRLLESYFALTAEEAEIVFDGAGPRDKSVFGVAGRMEVFFSGFSKDADTVIEEKVQASTTPRRLTVVSSDRRLRKAAAARSATAIKSELFWGRVQAELRRQRPVAKEPEAKQEGLTDGETEQWMGLFGLDD